jgi:hypothetical protein
MNDEIEYIVERAIEITEALPECYRVAAFAEILRYELGSLSSHSSTDTAIPIPPSVLHDNKTSRQQLTSGIPELHMIAKDGTRDQQIVWAVMELCQRGTEATSNTVFDIIKTDLGVTPEIKTNTSRRLRRLVPKYLCRKERFKGRGYAYSPTTEAAQVFKEQTAENGED